MTELREATDVRYPDLRYSEVEADLRASVRDLLEQRSPASQVLARISEEEGHDAQLWHILAGEMGLAGIAVPERFGGGGAGLREAAVVLEELGRSVAPVPFLTSGVVATAALLACDRGDLIADLASGRRVGVLAVPFTASSFTFAPTIVADQDQLTGQVRSVADGGAADILLVPTAGGLFAVDPTARGVTLTPVGSLDLTRPLVDVGFEAAVATRIAAGESASATVTTALTMGAALLASEQLGVAQWCLETTVDYVKSRYQFGRPVGSFQALKHRLADIWVDVTQARAVARYAASCAATADPDLPVAASLAQAFCGPVAVKAAEECVQLHGGIGFTWEHPAHLYLKRAKSAALAFGTADRHRARISALVDLPS